MRATRRSGRCRAAILLLVLVGVAGAAAAQAPKLGRSVQGVVLDAMNRPIPGAVVYLENVRTKVIHTAVSDDQGAYAFHDLQPNAGYQVYAVWRKHRSKVRTDSQYSSRQNVVLDLTIPVG